MGGEIQIKMKHIAIFGGLIVLIGVGLAFLFLPGDSSITGNVVLEEETPDIIDIDDDFPNVNYPHFPDNIITYSLEVDTAGAHIAGFEAVHDIQNTDDFGIERIEWALEVVEEASGNLIEFREVLGEETPDLRIIGTPDVYCFGDHEEYAPNTRKGIAYPLNTSGDIILESLTAYCAPVYSVGSSIGFSWHQDACEEFPSMEVQEILQSLGIGHTFTDDDSIMYPSEYRIQDCQVTKIDEEIKSCLKYIYSNGEQGEDCEGLNMYPWPEEDRDRSDFNWDVYPVSYSVSAECDDEQRERLTIAEKIIEDQSGRDLLSLKVGESNINFHCKDSTGNILFNDEADFFYDEYNYPAAQPQYQSGTYGVDKVDIYLFDSDNSCGGVELHEFLHGLGLRDHYGGWMQRDRPVCEEQGILDTESIDRLKELYFIQ